MTQLPKVEIIADASLGEVPDTCRILAEGILAAGGSGGVWRVGQDGALGAEARAALTQADGIIIVPSTTGSDRPMARVLNSICGIAQPGAIFATLAQGAAAPAQADAALAAGLTYVDMAARRGPTDLGLRDLGFRVADLALDQMSDRPEDLRHAA